jgi:16S rRNA (guanine1516-N2)-methyltransferase
MARRTVESRCEARVAEAEQVAVAAGAEVCSGVVETDEYRIVLFDDREELWDAASRRRGMPLSFRSIDRRVGTGNLSRKQPLGRAIGGSATTIIDATAGLGHDACLLACMGWRVMAIERDPFIAMMLTIAHRDATRCAALGKILSDGMTIQPGSAAPILQSLPTRPDVVYLDPMFALRKGSALPRKPAQILQALAEAGGDEALFDASCRAADRVVVKRPTGGPPIARDPDLIFKGRLVRYDVYLNTNSH